jgi:hypothetical protein
MIIRQSKPTARFFVQFVSLESIFYSMSQYMHLAMNVPIFQKRVHESSLLYLLKLPTLAIATLAGIH